MKIRLYGVCVAKLNIYYECNSKNKMITFYSEDMMNDNIEKDKFWKFYMELKKISSVF